MVPLPCQFNRTQWDECVIQCCQNGKILLQPVLDDRMYKYKIYQFKSSVLKTKKLIKIPSNLNICD